MNDEFYGMEILDLIKDDERSDYTRWSLDMDSCPTDKWVLLQSGTDETLVYLGQLTRSKDGSLQRKISKTFWKEDADEQFFRDSIVAWFDARNETDFLHEAHNATLLSRGPVVSCEKYNKDGSVAAIVYKKHTVPEYRRFVTLNPITGQKKATPEVSIRQSVLYRNV